MLDYKNISSATDRKNIREAFRLKSEIVNLTKKLEEKNSKIFDLVKEHNGISKESSSISYVRGSEDKKVFNESEFAKDYPTIYSLYLTKDRKGSKETLRYNLP